MKRNLVFVAVCWASTVRAQPITSTDTLAYRAAANSYSLLGVGTAVTRDCTVTAQGMRVRLERTENGLRFLTFIDNDGQEEAQCQVSVVVTAPKATVQVARK